MDRVTARFLAEDCRLVGPDPHSACDGRGPGARCVVSVYPDRAGPAVALREPADSGRLLAVSDVPGRRRGDGGQPEGPERQLALRQAREARQVLDWLRGDLERLDPEGIYEPVASHFGSALSLAHAEVLKATPRQLHVRARTGGRAYVLPREELARAGRVAVRRREFATGRHLLPRL
jgi:hypothetical protein